MKTKQVNITLWSFETSYSAALKTGEELFCHIQSFSPFENISLVNIDNDKETIINDNNIKKSLFTYYFCGTLILNI